MPSFEHQMLAELFRVCGELAPELLHRCAGMDLPHARVTLGSIDLSQVTSTEYRADAVQILRRADGSACGAVIIEVQLGRDSDKLLSWPAYVTNLRKEFACPVVLLVISDDPDVVRWARAPIETGHPRFVLEPIVLGFADLPRILDPERARTLPELAVLSTVAHPEIDVAKVAIDAVEALPEDRRRLYLDLIMSKLSPEIRQSLEVRMLELTGNWYLTDSSRAAYSQGHDAGMTQGRVAGLDEGLDRGREAGMRAVVLALVRVWFEPLACDLVGIEALCGEATLTHLVLVLNRVRSAEEARSVLDRALSRDD